LMANRGAKGYYRVFYSDPKDLMAVAGSAEKDLTVPERIALVEDAWAMTRAGKEPVGVFLDVARALRTERNRVVVGFIADHFDFIAHSLVPPEKKDVFREFVREQFAPLAKEIGWTGGADDDDEKSAMRASLLEILGQAGDPEAVALANKVSQDYKKDPKSVDGGMIGTALSIMAANGNAALYDQFLPYVEQSDNLPRRNYYLYLLTSFRQPELAKRTLALVDRGLVREQEYPRFFSAMLAESPNREIAWEYIKAHWDSLAEKVTSFGGRGAVPALGSSCSAAMRDDVKQFFANHRAPGAERAVQQSLARMNSCIEFQRAQSGNMEKWLVQPQKASQ
jgi:aminopeptidase N